jgi:parvulin-like peptidyl-prolyl isomerase
VSRREIALVVSTTLAVAVAVFCFILYNTALVPSSAAAKVNDGYLSEERVAAQIAQYRTAYGLEDDDAFASALLEQGLNVGTFRQNIINQLALADLVGARAEELGIEVAEEDVQAQLDAMKSTMAFDDDEVWEQTLATYGMSTDFLRTRYLENLTQQAVLEADVERRASAGDEEVLDYIRTYLAGTTQKHASRILFTGEGAKERAQECYEQLKAEAGEGATITPEAFAAAVREYSEEEGAAETGGAYAWSGSGEMSENATEVLEYLAVGAFSSPQGVGDSKSLEILYCDEDYAFPAADAVTSLEGLGVPEGLLGLIEEAAAGELWTEDCNSYLARLLLDARITYYPVPEDAVYNVDMALASLEEPSEEGDE